MYPGWPDAIRCGGGGDGTIYYAHKLMNRYDAMTSGDLNASQAVKAVIFNPDGSFSSVLNPGSGADCPYCTSDISGCYKQSIQKLYQEGRAFNFIVSRISDSTGATSMYPNWPDVLRCGVDGTDNGNAVFFAHALGGRYDQPDGASLRWVLFNSDGSWGYVGNYGCSACGNCYDCVNGCDGKSIQQLYREGRAFNFVASKTGGFRNTTSSSPNGDTSTSTSTSTVSYSVSVPLIIGGAAIIGLNLLIMKKQWLCYEGFEYREDQARTSCRGTLYGGLYALGTTLAGTGLGFVIEKAVKDTKKAS